MWKLMLDMVRIAVDMKFFKKLHGVVFQPFQERSQIYISALLFYQQLLVILLGLDYVDLGFPCNNNQQKIWNVIIY